MIYFDESGNSGDNLFDAQQPVFSLVSHNYNEYEAKMILQPLLTKRSKNEIHFTDIKDKPSYHIAILECLNHELILPERIHTFSVLKEFMVVVQIVEYLIEPVLHRHRQDLLKEGKNIAMANMIYLLGNNGWDKGLFQKMCADFIKWGRGKIEADEFYQSAQQLYDSVGNDLAPELVGLILMSSAYKQSVSKVFEKYAFDPTLPLFVSHCSHWGNRYKRTFDIGLDTSKPINYWRGMIDFLSKLPKAEVGYGGRKHAYPLLVGNITTFKSEESLQVQVSDLIVSALNYVLTKNVKNLPDQLAMKLLKTRLATLSGDSLWPSKKITPNELGTDGDVDGLHPLDYLAKQMHKTPGTIDKINSTKK